MSDNEHSNEHYILPNSLIFKIGGILLVLTGYTVYIAGVDLGKYNLIVAVLVATVKALLVAIFFMNLRHETSENVIIFSGSLLFLSIFMILTSTDMFFRHNAYVTGPLVMNVQKGKAKFKRPWTVNEELVSQGKEIFKVQCISCHGADGQGDGAAASALNPKPRNFHVAEGWKNGRKPSMIFKTLKEGLPPSAMAAYTSLSEEQRWALSHYVMTLGPQNGVVDAPEDFAKIGVDPNKDIVVAAEQVTVPVEVAMSELIKEAGESKAAPAPKLMHGAGLVIKDPQLAQLPGAGTYAQYCLACHGNSAQGGVIVSTFGQYPQKVHASTRALDVTLPGMFSEDAFVKTLVQGIPGTSMPSHAFLSKPQMKELYQFVLKARLSAH